MEYDEYGFPIKYNSGYGLGSTSKTNTGFDLNNLDPLTVSQPIKLDMSSLQNMNKVGPRVGSPGSIGFGASTATPNSEAFQGVYKGILSDTGEMGWSTDPAAFKAGTVEEAVWGDGKGLNFGQTPVNGKDGSLFGLSTGEWDNAIKAGQLGLVAGQLGLDIAGYFQNRGLADKQKQVLGQQIESNRAEIDARKNYRDALSKF